MIGSFFFRALLLNFVVTMSHAACYSVKGYTEEATAQSSGYVFPISGETCPDNTLCFSNEIVFESKLVGSGTSSSKSTGKKSKKEEMTGYSEYIGGTDNSVMFPPAYGSENVVNTEFATAVSAYGTTYLKAPSNICDGYIEILDMLNFNLNTGSYGCLQIIQGGTDGCAGVYGEFRVYGKLIFGPEFGCEGCGFDGDVCLD